MLSRAYVLLPLILLGCAAPASKPVTDKPPSLVVVAPAAQPCKCEPQEMLPPLQIPDAERYAPPPAIIKPGEPAKAPEYGLLRPTEWSTLNGFAEDDLVAAWPALLRSCGALRNREAWRNACAAASQLGTPDNQKIRSFLIEHFTPYQATNPDNTDTGLITGYYQPELNGSLTRTERYRYPLYSKPDDLISVELGSIYPELAGRRLRGRLGSNKLTPYYSRGEIDIVESPLGGKELLWVDDVVDLFFLQIQGSGIIKLENGESLPVGYADQNGHPYQSIGRVLIDKGELTPDKTSMQGIKDWGRRNPDKLRELLNANPSYVFFRELPGGLPGPLGALGVPIAAERSIAVDPRFIPLGAPVFLSTTYPNSGQPLRRVMLAQDTGGAIKGSVRADFFWGAGFEAGRQAGAMRQQGKIWVFLPKEWAKAAN